MIEQADQQCRACGRALRQVPGRKPRLFCNAVCKVTFHRRKRHAEDQAARLERWSRYAVETRIALEAAMAHSSELAHMVEDAIIAASTQVPAAREADERKDLEEHVLELEEELRRLREQLDIEARYLRDEEPRAFKGWLLKRRPTRGYPSGSFQQRFLDDARFMEPRLRRTDYMYRLEIFRYSVEDRARFAELWKAMLLQP